MPKPTSLTRADIELLTSAVNEAECWRGAKHPDEWPTFDSRISRMREALGKVKRLQREAKARELARTPGDSVDFPYVLR